MATNGSTLAWYALSAQAAYARFGSSDSIREDLLTPTFGDFTVASVDHLQGLTSGASGSRPSGLELRHHLPNDSTGFSASIFLDREREQFVLAVRGTEEVLRDGAEDVSRIGFQGFAGAQAVSLYRYVKSATTSPGASVSYSDAEIRLLLSMRAGVPIDLSASSRFANRLRAELAADKGLAALNLGAGPVIPAGSLITATGHSLGGHLALLFGRLFPNSVDGVFTYNAPGISTNGERLLQLLGVQPIGGGKVANVASAMGAEAVSRIWGKPGAKIGVYTEPGGALYTHSIVPLSDALALYGVIATLAPDLSTNYREIARLIAASSVRPESSLEQAL